MKPPTFLTRLIRTLRPAQHHTFASSAVNERNVTQGLDWSALYRDRYSYDRQRLLDETLLAWRLNPLARRIVELQTQYITDGIEFRCDDPQTEAFLREFWNHPLNRLGEHLREWSDELALTGNLFPCITTDAAGMSYVRIFPTDLIADIETRPNDVQQETAYLVRPTALRDEASAEPQRIPNYWSATTLRKRMVMLHYSVNRLAGMAWGEPDLAPLLPWLARYAAWLEDRMRLNRFRQAYLYVVRGMYASQAELEARQVQLANNPPQPGSILVAQQGETWEVLHPNLDSFDANADGMALKKFIASGRGLPLHWLAEPESSTRTTAEAAGTPTFKTLESRQRMFMSLLKDLLTVVVERRAARRGDVDPRAGIVVQAADITERDNAALALASTQVVESFGQLWANGFIDADEYLRVVYRFAGEVRPEARPDNPQGGAPRRAAPSRPELLKTDPESGDVRIKQPRK